MDDLPLTQRTCEGVSLSLLYVSLLNTGMNETVSIIQNVEQHLN